MTGGIFSDPPFTNGVNVLSYQMPGSILVGAGAVEAARVGICLLGETGVTVPGLDPVHPLLVACRVGEGPLLPVIEAPYVATETVTPGVPSVRLQRIAIGPSLAGAATVVSVPPTGFVELAPATQVTVEASFENVAPTSATLFAAGLTGPTTALPATVSTSARTLTRTVSIDPRQEAVSLRMEAQAPGIRVADSMVLRPRRQRAKLHTVVFADAAGTPAIAADVLARNRRQAALELAAMCSTANGVFLTDSSGVPVPGLDPSFVELGSGAQPVVVADAAGADLVLMRNGALSLEARRLVVSGLLPSSNSDPGNRIPNPVMAGPAAVRVFVAKTFKRQETEGGTTMMEFDIPQDTETGISQFGQAFFQIPVDFEDLQQQMPADAVIVQARSGDLEAGALKTARPVASSLAHELAHVLGGVQDSGAEQIGSGTQSFAFPAPSDPSVMNSFPFFRSLRIGSTAPVDCVEAAGGVPSTAVLCGRILNGYTCGGPAIDFTE